MTEMTAEGRADLKSTISYALRFKCVGMAWKRVRDLETAADIAADAIVRHLELANFKRTKGPPLPLATTDQQPPGSIRRARPISGGAGYRAIS